MKSFGITDVGKKRSMNQDSIFYTDEPIGAISNLYIVADGMGGTLHPERRLKPQLNI